MANEKEIYLTIEGMEELKKELEPFLNEALEAFLKEELKKE